MPARRGEVADQRDGGALVGSALARESAGRRWSELGEVIVFALRAGTCRGRRGRAVSRIAGIGDDVEGARPSAHGAGLSTSAILIPKTVP